MFGGMVQNKLQENWKIASKITWYGPRDGQKKYKFICSSFQFLVIWVYANLGLPITAVYRVIYCLNIYYFSIITQKQSMYAFHFHMIVGLYAQTIGSGYILHNKKPCLSCPCFLALNVVLYQAYNIHVCLCCKEVVLQ